MLLGGRWLLRLEGGSTRRTNAVNPLRARCYDPRPILEAARSVYAAHGRPCVFRVPSIAAGLDERLDEAKFVAGGEVSTLFTSLDGSAPRFDPDVEIVPEANEAWLDAKFRLTPKIAEAPLPFRTMVAAILLPKAFAALRQDGAIRAVAYGAIQHELLVVESVTVDAATRRRGYGRRLVATLLAWGRDLGARSACLQVEADNAPALALYRRLGFDTDLYRYLYRTECGYRPPDTVRIEPTA